MTKTISTPIGTAPVLPVVIMSFGAYVAWFGVHYWRSDTAWPSDPIKAVLTGKPIPTPDRSADEAAIKGIVDSAKSAPAAAGNVVQGPGIGDGVAATAVQYIGQGYVFGGPADRPGNWDCSSFVSYVLGHDMSRPLPGGKWGDPGFPPHAHGPTTNNYMLWGSPIAAGQERKGDLIVSSEHMGIVVTPGTYISARTPAAGTGLSNYSGSNFPGGAPVFRRVV